MQPLLLATTILLTEQGLPLTTLVESVALVVAGALVVAVLVCVPLDPNTFVFEYAPGIGDRSWCREGSAIIFLNPADSIASTPALVSGM